MLRLHFVQVMFASRLRSCKAWGVFYLGGKKKRNLQRNAVTYVTKKLQKE